MPASGLSTRWRTGNTKIKTTNQEKKPVLEWLNAEGRFATLSGRERLDAGGDPEGCGTKTGRPQHARGKSPAPEAVQTATSGGEANPASNHPLGGLFLFPARRILILSLWTSYRHPSAPGHRLRRKERTMRKPDKGFIRRPSSSPSSCSPPAGAARAFDRNSGSPPTTPMFNLEPDSAGTVIDTLVRGHVLSLLYSGKSKKSWYYVCFRSEKSGSTKSGYILESAVELLFDPPQEHYDREESQDLGSVTRPGLRGDAMGSEQRKRSWSLKGNHRPAEGGDLEVLRYQQVVINLDCAIDYSSRLTSISLPGFPSRRLLDKTSISRIPKDQGSPRPEVRPAPRGRHEWRDASYKDDFSSWARR